MTTQPTTTFERQHAMLGWFADHIATGTPSENRIKDAFRFGHLTGRERLQQIADGNNATKATPARVA